MRTVHFEKDADFSRSTFNGETALIGTRSEGRFRLVLCRFNGPARLSSCHFFKEAEFHSSVFCQEFELYSNFYEMGNFGNCVFHSAVKFQGSRNISVGIDTARIGFRTYTPDKITERGTGYQEEITKVFWKYCNLSNVSFLNPSRVTFQLVDLRCATVWGTNFRGVTFIDVDWYQQALGRRGIFDHVYLIDNNDKNYVAYMLPRVETAYRHMRSTFEEARDFSIASDFYVNELDVRRWRQGGLCGSLLSVAAAYGLCSRYGTSIPRALIVFLLIYVLYALLSAIHLELYYIRECLLCGISCILCPLVDIFKVLIHCARGLLFLPTSLGHSLFEETLDTIFRVAAVLQVAQIGFSIRNSIRR